jgi:hypothetical protein
MDKIKTDKLDLTKIGKYNEEILRKIIFSLIAIFNYSVDAFNEYEKNNELKPIYAQSIIFNLTIVHKMANVLESSIRDSNPPFSKIRNCIAHLDERILSVLKGKQVKACLFNTEKIKYENGKLKSMIGVRAQDLTIYLDPTGQNTYLSAISIGFFDNYIVGVDNQLQTIYFEINSDIMQFYKDTIDRVIKKFSN